MRLMSALCFLLINASYWLVSEAEPDGRHLLQQPDPEFREETVLMAVDSSANRPGAATISDPAQVPAPGVLSIKDLSQPILAADYIIRIIKGDSSEYGDKAILEIQLNTRPTDTVTLHISSSDPGEGQVFPDKLVFTPADWADAREVSIVGQDDFVMDGDRAFEITFLAESDRDLRFTRLPEKSVTLVNKDNDNARIILNQQRVYTSESGETVDFTVSLGSQPTGPVSIPVNCSNRREASVSPATIVFLPENWQEHQTVSVRGQDDWVADGDMTYTVRLGPAQSDDPQYDGMLSEPLTFINRDNDTAGFIISGPAEPVTSEAGGAVDLSVQLTSQPLSEVLISVSSSNRLEGNPYPSELIITPKNWKEPQHVRIIGQDDFIADGDVRYRVIFSSKQATDPAYRKLADEFLELVNQDNDKAGIRVGPVRGTLSENNESARFDIRLESEPLSSVDISVSSSNPEEGIVGNTLIRFTPQNWSVVQEVQVMGVDDSVVDGDSPVIITIRVAESSDPEYQVLDPVHLDLVNRDNDTAGFVITPPEGKTSENGNQVVFGLSLSSKPAAMVTVELHSSDETEGVIDRPNVSFSPEEWNHTRFITVTGVNDQEVDGEQNYTIVLQPAVSSDPMYNGLDPDDVPLSNLDNNLTTFFVSKVRGNTGEDGRKTTIHLRLNEPPAGQVKLNIESDNPQEGRPDLEQLVFDADNWHRNQSVTVSGVDDAIDDGDIPYNIIISSSSSTDPAYNDIPPVSINLINEDDDTAGILIRLLNQLSAEDGSEAAFSIRLTSEPISSVVLLFQSTDPGEGQLVTKYAAFNDSNWDKEQIIAVRGVPDQQVDGNKTYSIISSGAVSSDPKYDTMPFEAVNLVNKDMDTAVFLIEPSSGYTTEAGGTASFTARLSSRPQSPVTIALRSDNPREGIIDRTRLEFDETSWDVAQRVTVTGVDDFIKDEDKLYHIVFSSAVSGDKSFHGLTPNRISLKNLDNKRLTGGLLLFYTSPLGHFADDFDAAPGFALTGGYVYNGYATITTSLQSTSLTGTLKRSLFGVSHKVRQTLTLNSLFIGVKLRLLKLPLQISAEPFLSLINWTYQSKTLTDGTEQEEEGMDFGAGVKVGIDYPVYANLFFETGIRVQQLSGGLGNRQTASLLAGFNSSF